MIGRVSSTFQYPFTAEQRFLNFLEKEKDSHNTPASSSTNGVDNQSTNSSADTNSTSLNVNDRDAYQMLKLFESPLPLVQNNQPLNRRTPPVQSPSNQTGLEEFEGHGRNVFDLMELRCIDEKAELESLWNTSSSTDTK